MNLDEGDEPFVTGLTAWLAALDDESAASFEAVMSLSPGYFPTTLFDAWQRELQRRQLKPADPERAALERPTLPVSHPLDYDWRFAPATRLQLVRMVGAQPSGSVIAYLGAPTLFAEARMSDIDHRHVLVDANAAMVDPLRDSGAEAHLAYLGHDDLADVPRANFFVLDPPWYPDASDDFLAAAAFLAEPRARLVLSQPTMATRPGVADERRRLLETARAYGWQVDGNTPIQLRYATPHFERMTIADENPRIPVTLDWRSGELLGFDFVGSNRPYEPSTVTAASEWTEQAFGPVRVKLRVAGGEDLLPVAPGADRLSTVSRRDPLRARVGFWTSGNRVRTLTRVADVGECIARCHNDLLASTFSHVQTARHAADLGLPPRVGAELFEILLLEYQEHVAAGYGVVG